MATKKEVETFLSELTKLCHKHNLYITYTAACGVCLYEEYPQHKFVYVANKPHYLGDAADSVILENPNSDDIRYYDFIGEK